MSADGLHLDLYHFSFPLSFPSLHKMLLLELTSSTVGAISDLYTHSSVSNKICITNPIKQDANITESSCWDFYFKTHYAFPKFSQNESSFKIFIPIFQYPVQNNPSLTACSNILFTTVHHLPPCSNILFKTAHH